MTLIEPEFQIWYQRSFQQNLLYKKCTPKITDLSFHKYFVYKVCEHLLVSISLERFACFGG